MRLADLKAQAQEHYRERLDWTDVGHHTISVMVAPPTGNPYIAVIRGGQQRPLERELKCALTVVERAIAPNATAPASVPSATGTGAMTAMIPASVPTATETDAAVIATPTIEPVIQLALTF